MNDDFDLIQKKLLRERAARKEAEMLLEVKSRELYDSNQKLKVLNSNLEGLVEERTRKLVDAEQEYHVLVESITDLICKIDLSKKIIFANQIATKLLGKEKTELIGTNVFEFIPKHLQKKVFIYFARQFIKRNCISSMEIPITVASGKEMWMFLNVQFSEERCSTCSFKQEFLVGKSSTVCASSVCKFNEVIIVAHDITDQKLGQLELEKSEKRYRELTESLPELICEVDKKGIVTYANQYAIDKFGYEKEEIVGNAFSIFRVFNKRYWNLIVKNISKILEDGTTFSNEYMAMKKNGDEFPVIVYSSPMYSKEQIVGIRGVMVDITDRKKSELEIAKNLRQQEILSAISVNYNSLDDFRNKTNETLRIIGEHTDVSRAYIFENSSDGTLTSNTYEWCNKGIEPQIEELQDIPYSMIPSWKKILLKKGIVYSENIKKMPKDIRDILEPQGIHSIIVLPLFVSREFFGFIGFDECNEQRKWTKSELELLRTISNIISNAYMRNAIQSKLVESVKENKGIIDSIPDEIIRLNQKGKIIAYKSKQKKGIFSKLNEGDNYIQEILDLELSKSFLSGAIDCLNNESSKFDFHKLIWDEIEYFEARMVKLSGEEVLVIVRNVTEIKENERQLNMAREKAEEASKAKSEFLANVSHEIRTPMNAIIGFSEWLYDNVENPQHKNYLHTILSSGRNLLALINDILDLSKIESGKLNIEMSPVRVEIILDEIKNVFKQKLEIKNLAFKINIDPLLLNYIYLDEVRFYQILYNLVGNSIKFTSKGYIYVSAFARKKLADNLIDLVINVEDTGIGIGEDQQEKIFNAFVQTSGQSNRYHEGTGLGLTIISGLLKKLNGEISLKSKIGKGSTFSVTLKDVRLAEYIEDKNSEANHTQLGFEPFKVLIIDDLEFNILVLKKMIEFENVTFIEASTAEQGLELIQIDEPDIIFMDIRLPGMSGYAATEILKNNQKLKHIPVVAFTASIMQNEIDKIHTLFDGFLQKPVFRKDVVSMLKKFIPYNYNQSIAIENKEEISDLAEFCKEQLPDIISKLETAFLPEWETIKNDLIIYDIEAFSTRLTDFAMDMRCEGLKQYCRELNMGIQSFDIEVIEKKINDFGPLLEKMKDQI